MDKQQIRQYYLKIREDIVDKKEKSNIISNKIINHPFYQSNNIIGIYIPKVEEVDITPVISHALSNGKTIVIPRVNDSNLEFYIFDPHQSLIRSKYGVLEPPISNTKIDIKNIPIYFVPGVAFDNDGHRIGYGKGYFDKALKDINIYKIGICYKEQISNKELPNSNNDIKMDEIIHD